MPPDNIDGLINQLPPHPRAQLPRSFGLATLGLVLCFAIPLWDLANFAVGNELFSYILLIPFISFYLVWLKRNHLPPTSQPARGMTAGFLAAGTMVLMIYWLALRPRLKLMEADYLAVMLPAFLMFFWGVCSWFLGRQFLRANAFALGFLIFMVPIPTMVVRGIESFLQYGSAAVARGFFTIAGTSYLNDGLVFQLPGISLQIAPECSGIHSSLVLLIISLLAGYFFLRTPWKQAVLIAAVIPLAILRNGFRVFTIGELCVHIGPHMIDSPIHRKGGPLFFALSLIPLFILLVSLYKSEPTGGQANAKSPGSSNPIPPE